jgi:hypothetical protein
MRAGTESGEQTMSFRAAHSAVPADDARFQRGFRPSGHQDEPPAPDLKWDEAAGAEEHAAHQPIAFSRRSGVDVRWIIALFAMGIALMVGAALLYKVGWLAQGGGTYAVDSYGQPYSSTSGRTLDDIVFEDFLLTINPYLFLLGAATVLGTIFLLAVRGVRRTVD